MINHFFGQDGEAMKLQEKLHAWDQSRQGSWLTPFWDDLYLKSRDPLPFSTNFNVLLKNKSYNNRVTELAGKISVLVAEYYHKIIDEKIEPSMYKGKPLDMGQYKNIFRSVRVPKLERDDFRVADFNKKNNHVVILHRNNIYKVPVTNHEGIIYQSIDIADAIEAAINDGNPAKVNVGIFTAAERNLAAKIYDKLNIYRENVETLQAIADSLVIISIDEKSTEAKETLKNLMFDATNKYFDKTVQIIITKSGKIGFNVEHSAVDGTSISTVVSYVSKGLMMDLAQTNQTDCKPIVERKSWIVTEEIEKQLRLLKKIINNRKRNISY